MPVRSKAQFRKVMASRARKEKWAMSDEWTKGVNYDSLPERASPSDPRNDPKATRLSAIMKILRRFSKGK